MTDDLERYEVFIKSVAGFINIDLTSTIWSWRRSDAAGRTLVTGGSHPSLEASFASIRRHAARFGEAPIKINLRGPEEPVSAGAANMSAARRETNATMIDEEYVRRERRRAQALAAALAPFGSRAAYSPPYR
jgi:hypothetical protein